MDLSDKVRPEKETCDLLSAHIKGLIAFFLRISLFQVLGQNFQLQELCGSTLYPLSDYCLLFQRQQSSHETA